MNTLSRVRSIRRAHLEASVNLTKRRTWYAEDEPATDTTDAEEKPAKGKTLPPDVQEEVNKIAGKARLEGKESGKSEAMADLLKSLGVDKLEDATAAIKERNALRDSQLTETQRLEKERDEAKKEAEDAKAARAAMEQERQLDRRNDDIKTALTTARCSNPVKVMALMSVMQADELKATLKADGTVDKVAMNKLIDTAKKEHKEYFVGGGPGSPSNNNGRTSNQGDRVALKRPVQA